MYTEDIILWLIGQSGQFLNSSELLSQAYLYMYVKFRKIWSKLSYADKVENRRFKQSRV